MAVSSRSRLMIAMGIVFVLALAFAGARFMNVPQAENRAASAWGEVELQFQLRAYVAQEIIDAVSTVNPAQVDLLASLEEKRQHVISYPFNARTPHNDEQFRAFMTVQDQLSVELGKALDLMQLYPERRNQPPVSTALARLAQSESRIVMARSDYVRAAKTYNRLVTNIPTRWFAGLVEPEALPLIVSFDLSSSKNS